MMAEENEQPFSIFEARETKMVSRKNGDSTVRIARFLKPISNHVNEATGIPKTPLLSEIFSHNLQQWPSKVIFRGFNQPQKKWKQWVDRLAEKYGSIWNQTGICDAIMSSTYEVRCNRDLVLGLCEFWCSETNTFVFSWGEATITLEDVMILGGYSVIGDPLESNLMGQSQKIVDEMNLQRKKMSQTKAKKAGHSVWLKHFMEEKQNEFEHVAFLSLWLSRYVFPSNPEETIVNHVFPIAAQLSQGVKLGLAQAVLANLYQNLRLLKEQAVSSLNSIVVSGPFQLVQLWAFEHFSLMAPNSPNLLLPGEPRVARWHKLNSKINLPLVRSALRLAENFRWRPYVENLKNWRHLSYYKETSQLIYNSSSLDEELQAFFTFLQASKIVGIDCEEKYSPQRVAMQFGMDQDLPCDNFGCDVIGRKCQEIKFYVPPRSFEPSVSVRYFNWWKSSIRVRRDSVKEVLVQKGKMGSKNCPLVQENMRKKDFRTSIEPKTKNPKKACTSSPQVSTKSTSKVCPASVLSKYPFKMKTETIKKQVLSKTNPNFKKLSQVSSKSHAEESHASFTPQVPPRVVLHESSDDDDILLAKRLKRRSGIASRTANSCEVHVEEKLASATPQVPSRVVPHDSSDDDIPLAKRFEISSGIASRTASSCEVQRASVTSQVPSRAVPQDSSDDNIPLSKRFNLCSGFVSRTASSCEVLSSHRTQDCVSPNPITPKENSQKGNSLGKKEAKPQGKISEPNSTAREGKRKAFDSANDPLDVLSLSERIKHRKCGKNSVQCVDKEWGQEKAGKSLKNPKNVDGYIGKSTSGYIGLDLEGRLQKIEKLLGVNQ